jgi:hypothetical protein
MSATTECVGIRVPNAEIVLVKFAKKFGALEQPLSRLFLVIGFGRLL